MIKKPIHLEIPTKVRIIEDFCQHKNLWHNITPNKGEAKSGCIDAAKRRFRLGKYGIALRDELKSYIGKIENSGSTKYIVIHCRGDKHVNDKKVGFHLNGKFKRIFEKEIVNKFGLSKGLVNPINMYLSNTSEPILQVFDSSLTTIQQPPYTLMTNASHFNWGIEFKPNELISVIENVKILDIVDTPFNEKEQTIGILTGNAPLSGSHLWHLINEKIKDELKNDFCGDISLPMVFIKSSPAMGLSMQLDIRENDTWSCIKNGISDLCNFGVDMLCIACNTSQYFNAKIEDICSENGVEYLSIPEIAKNYLVENNIFEFDFIGIDYVVDFEKWSGFKNFFSAFNIYLPTDADTKEIIKIAYDYKQKGILGSSILKLREIINDCTKTNNILIALTELSILNYNQKKKKRSNKQIIDSLELLADEITRKYLFGY